MDWKLARQRVVDEIARLSHGNGRAGQETADALERCLALADEVDRSRAVHADLRGRLDQAEQAAAALHRALQEIEAAYCRCDGRQGMPWWWSASEGPGGVVFGALLFVLAVPLTRRMELHDPFGVRDVRLDAGDGTSRRPGG
jgi:hypothetical protein